MATERKPQELRLQQERNAPATRPKLLASTKASTRGRELSCGHGVSSRGIVSSREAGEGPKGMHGSYSGAGGSHKPVKVEKEGGTETLQTSPLKSSRCADLHPGSQRKKPHKGSSFGSTSSYLTKSSVAGRQKRDSSASGAAPPGQGEGRKDTREDGSSRGVQQASGQHATESVDGASLSKSATVSRLQREVTELRQENATLKKELADVRSLSEQLLHEVPSENFAERRVQLLKSQIIQLERQVLLLSQAVSSNTEILLELQNMLDSFLHKMSTLVKATDSSVTVPRHDIDDIISRVRTMKGRLTKRSQCSSVESLAQPLMFLDAFLKPSRTSEAETPATLIDVCSGKTEHLNLRHVSRLESRLAELYAVLVGLEASLQTIPPNGPLPSLFQPVREHLGDHVTKSCKLIGDCCHSLLCLSLLVPAAPWPPLKSSEVSLDLRADTILDRLPPFVRNKKEGREVIEAAARAFNYHNQMQVTKCQALEQELQFHKSVYELQLKYVETLFGAMGKGYQTFEQSAQELICQPLQAILQHYQELKQTASEESLRKFLQAFQENHQQLQNANESLKALEPCSGPQTQTQPQGLVALSLFGQHFFESLSELETECSRERNSCNKH